MQETTEKSEQADLIGYPISLKKFIIFDLISFGVFERVWAIKQYRAIHGKDKGKTAMAVVSAIFLPITLFSLLKDLEAKSAEAGFPITFSKYAIAISYFIIGVVVGAISRVPTIPDWVTIALGPLSIIPIAVVQHKINLLNDNLRPGVPFAPRLSWQSWLCIALSIGFLLLSLIGLFLPQS